MNSAAIKVLKELIAFDTVSHRGNLDFMAYIQNYLDGFGINSTLIESPDGRKANLHACIGPVGCAGIVLSGHSDVVPVEGQDWHSDPFVLTEKNDAFYGRGTADMKGFIAAVLSKIPQMVETDLKIPFHLAFSYDEEVGCLGVSSLVDFLFHEVETPPALCIIGEPSQMIPINAHKGGHHVRCIVTGLEYHSSLAPYGVNALEYAADLVSHIKSVAGKLAEFGPFNTDFDPPYTTLNTGIFKSGTALNIIPNYAEVEFALRTIPGQDSDDIVTGIKDYAFRMLEPHMKAIDPKCGFEFTDTVKIPAFSIDDNSDIVQLALNLSGENRARKVSFATEAGYFQQAGIPTVICGPGNIEQAHKPDEYIKTDQLIKCENFLDGLIIHACR